MRLIDGNRLVKETMPQYKELMGTDIGHGMGMMLAEISAAHTIDAVPVVRCTECKHRDTENHHCDHPAGATIYFPRKDDDFCSYGERNGGDG